VIAFLHRQRFRKMMAISIALFFNLLWRYVVSRLLLDC
jgi:hypothetical protein